MSSSSRRLIYLHVVAISLSTLIAVIEIETILVTGVVCSLTGFSVGVIAMMNRQKLQAFAAWSTPGIALLLLFLESQILHLGPPKAALPFSIVFILNQAIVNYILLRDLSLQSLDDSSDRPSFSVQSVLLMMTVIAVGLAIVRACFPMVNSWIVFVALVLFGITITGVVMIGTRRPKSTAAVTDIT